MKDYTALAIFGWMFLIALLVAAGLSGRVKQRNASVLLRGEPEEVVRDLRLAVSGVRGHSATQDSPQSIVVSFMFMPTWAIVVCVAFFPLGLLALLARRQESSTLIAEEGGADRTRLRIGGRFTGTGIAAINRVIDARS